MPENQENSNGEDESQVVEISHEEAAEQIAKAQAEQLAGGAEVEPAPPTESGGEVSGSEAVAPPAEGGGEAP